MKSDYINITCNLFKTAMLELSFLKTTFAFLPFCCLLPENIPNRERLTRVVPKIKPNNSFTSSGTANPNYFLTTIFP